MKKIIALLAAMAWPQSIGLASVPPNDKLAPYNINLSSELKLAPDSPIYFQALERKYLTPAETQLQASEPQRLRLAPDNSTSFYVEAQKLSVPGGTQLQFNLLRNLDETFGLFAFGQIFLHQGQIYGGPTYSPVPWLKIGTGLGFQETARLTLRSGSFLRFGNDNNYWLTIGEISDNNYWWHSETNHKISDWFGLGLLAQSDAGIGPRLQLTIPNKPISFWLSPTYFWETGKPRFVCGLRYQF